MKGARKKLSCENQAFTLSTIQNDLTTYLIIYSTTLKSTVQVPLFLRNGFFTFLLQLFGTDFGRGEIFGHCSAKFRNRLAPVMYANPLYHLCSGGLMLGAIFMATDYVTSPMTPKGMVVYGVGIGLLTVIIRYFGAYPEGMSFAILIMNAVNPLICNWCKPKRFGRVKK